MYTLCTVEYCYYMDPLPEHILCACYSFVESQGSWVWWVHKRQCIEWMKRKECIVESGEVPRHLLRWYIAGMCGWNCFLFRWYVSTCFNDYFYDSIGFWSILHLPSRKSYHQPPFWVDTTQIPQKNRSSALPEKKTHELSKSENEQVMSKQVYHLVSSNMACWKMDHLSVISQ